MCFHSTWRMKFSYCFSERITPMGWPVQTSSSPFLVHVSGDVLTSIHDKGISFLPDVDVRFSRGIRFPNSTRAGWEKDSVTRKSRKQKMRQYREVLIGSYFEGRCFRRF